MDAATSKVENSAQGSSCKLKFVHDSRHSLLETTRNGQLPKSQSAYEVIKKGSQTIKRLKGYGRFFDKMALVVDFLEWVISPCIIFAE
jgi:hypothetical protein